MSYKQVRKDGRYVTIDTRTGEEVGAFQGQLKPVGNFLNDMSTMARVTLSDIMNLPNDIMPHLIYSDTAVDKKGRPLTKAQAGEVTGPNRDARLQDILGTAPQTPTVKKTIQTLDPKRVSDAGVDTSTGKVTEAPQPSKTFQELQQGLMGDIADRYTNPQTAALIRGVPTNPFSSTQLPYTSDNLSGAFENTPQMDFGIDPSKMLENAKNVDYSKAPENMPGFTDGITLEDSFTEGYVSPVNYNAAENAGNPMLNSNIDSMHAMRMKDRDLGLMYASGQFFAEGKDGSPVLVNRQLAKSVRRGDEGAKDQLAAYLAGGGIKPQGGVIEDPDRDLMVPPKADESQITPTPGEFPSYSAISTADFTNTGGFSPNMTSSLVDDEYDLPSFTKKAGFDFGSKPNTGMFAIDPEVYKVMQDSNNPYFFKD